MGKQLKKIKDNVANVCGYCQYYNKCNRLLGAGCVFANGSLVPEFKDGE